MTWTWELSGTDVLVYDHTDTQVASLAWSDYKPPDSNANNWTWKGEYPDEVKEVVMFDEYNTAVDAREVQRALRINRDATFEQIQRR